MEIYDLNNCSSRLDLLEEDILNWDLTKLNGLGSAQAHDKFSLFEVDFQKSDDNKSKMIWNVPDSLFPIEIREYIINDLIDASNDILTDVRILKGKDINLSIVIVNAGFHLFSGRGYINRIALNRAFIDAFDKNTNAQLGFQRYSERYGDIEEFKKTMKGVNEEFITRKNKEKMEKELYYERLNKEYERKKQEKEIKLKPERKWWEIWK